jgi:hypothetical protein
MPFWPPHEKRKNILTVVNRWDEKAGLRRDAVRSQVIDVLEAQEIKETGLLIPSDFNRYPTA